MKGRFIVSLDCEGKWGMADKLQPYHDRLLTDEALARVYEDIVDLFERHEIAATFAFVLAFTMDESERARFARLFEIEDFVGDVWLSHFRKARQQGRLGGWFQPRALDTVQRRARHEIACHGFCHRSLADRAARPTDAATELDAAETVAQSKGLSLQTLVYPRNAVGNLRALVQKGYLGFRDERPRPPGRLGPIKSMVDELNLWPQPEAPARGTYGDIVRIPAGNFFNWRFGPRRLVPPAVTVRRWTTLLNRAADTGGVAHLWFHPHNLITGPETREPLEAVLKHASRLARMGRLEVVTQEAYCRQEMARHERKRDD